MGRLSHYQMPQISLMAHSVIITNTASDVFGCKVRQNRLQYQSIIRICDPAAFYRHHIIKTAAPMHSQRKRSVLHLIPESKFHLIPIAVHLRTTLNTFPVPVFLLPLQTGIQQAFYLFSLNPELFLIGHGKIGASSAHAKMGTRKFRLQR